MPTSLFAEKEFDPLNILVCPVDRGSLTYDADKLKCSVCNKSYDIVSGIPIFISGYSTKQVTSQQEYFDKEFAKYDSYKIDNWRKVYLDNIFKFLDLGFNDESKTYIDIGVGGSGYTVIEAARNNKISIGTDISLKGMLKAQEFSRKEGVSNRTLFVLCNAENLPFKDASFDRLSSIAVLEHLFADWDAASEISRISKLTSKIYITTPNSYDYLLPVVWPFMFIYDKNIGHLRHYSKEGLTKLFNKYSYTLTDYSYSGHWPKMFQYISSFFVKSDKLWWYFEQLEKQLYGDPFAINVSVCLERK